MRKLRDDKGSKPKKAESEHKSGKGSTHKSDKSKDSSHTARITSHFSFKLVDQDTSQIFQSTSIPNSQTH